MNLNIVHGLGMPAIWPRDLSGWLPPGREGVGEIPFTRDEIQARWDTHILLPVMDISIMDIVTWKEAGPLARGLYFSGTWWYDEPNMFEMCRAPLAPRWMLLNLQPARFIETQGPSRMYEHEHAFERLLGIREALYALLVLDALDYRPDIRDKEFVVLADADPWHPFESYLLWKLCGKYVLNTARFGGLQRYPHYALSEYVHVGPQYGEEAA